MSLKRIASALLLPASFAVQAAPALQHGRLDVDGVSVFYREAGDPARRTLVLLHGFPASSQMYVELMQSLADRYHVIAPDYPGFGHTTVAEGARFEPSFDGITDVMERFLAKKGLTRYALYMQDFGGPVGMRLAVRHPEQVSALVVQNANAYDEGLSDELRKNIRFMSAGINAETRPAFDGVVSPKTVHFMFTAGTRHPEQLNPDGWTLADASLQVPANRAVQQLLLADYHRNVEQYPVWQRYLREHKPATLVVWGRNDPLFTPAGATAIRRDLPTAEVHLLDTGHFALQEDHAEIARYTARFLDRVVR